MREKTTLWQPIHLLRKPDDIQLSSVLKFQFRESQEIVQKNYEGLLSGHSTDITACSFMRNSGGRTRAKGVKGMLPLGCLPLWGIEGVTLIPFTKSRESGSYKPYRPSFSFRFPSPVFFLRTLTRDRGALLPVPVPLPRWMPAIHHQFRDQLRSLRILLTGYRHR